MNEEQPSIPCYECDRGHYEEIKQEYLFEIEGEVGITVSNVPHLVCSACGDICLSREARRMIEDVVLPLLNTDYQFDFSLMPQSKVDVHSYKTHDSLVSKEESFDSLRQISVAPEKFKKSTTFLPWSRSTELLLAA